MKVSIITVVYNNVDTVAEAVESVIGQDFKDIEYIVIDGASDDGTLNVLEEYKEHIDLLISEPDEGIYDAMNKGLRQATGDIVGFLNADDLMASPDCISTIVGTFKKKEVDVVYGDNLYVDREDPEKVVRTWEPGPYRRERFETGWMPPHLATYIKKAYYDRYGHFDPDIEIAADYELMFRFMYVHGARSVYLPKVISKMRMGGVSNASLGVIIDSAKTVYRIWKRHDQEVSPLIMLQKPLRKLKQYF